MKKNIALLSFLFIVIISVLFFTSRQNNNENQSIPVVYPVTVDALQKIGKGIVDSGIDIVEFSAEGDHTKFSTVIDVALSKKSDAIITIGTQITNAVLAKKYDKIRPFIIATAISDPNNIIIPQDSKMIIISDNPKSTPKVLDYAIEKLALPYKTVGIISNKSELNSISTAKIAEKVYKNKGSNVIYGFINSSAEITPVVKSLINKGVETIIIPHDKLAVGNASTIVKSAYEKNIPVVSLDEGTVEKHGVLLGVSIDYKKIGNIVAKKYKDFKNNNVVNHDVIFPEITDIIINKQSADKFNVNIDNLGKKYNIKIIN